MGARLRVSPTTAASGGFSREAIVSRTPASFVFFDVLSVGDDDFTMRPLATPSRSGRFSCGGSIRSMSLLRRAIRKVAADWFQRFEGAGLDGVVAKPVSGTYEPNKRVMFKVKHERDCDCVVAGFRWHKKGDRTLVGSLLLGLFDDAGALQHVGVCASFSNAKRLELVEFLSRIAKMPWRTIPGKLGPISICVRSNARRPKPMEPGQRFVLGTFAARACRRSCLRSHARRPFPSYGAVPKMALRQETDRLHLCAARSYSAAGDRSNFPIWSLRRLLRFPRSLFPVGANPAWDRRPDQELSCSGSHITRC